VAYLCWSNDELEGLRKARQIACDRVDAELIRLRNGFNGGLMTRDLASAIQSFNAADKAYSDALTSRSKKC
jgi:hypothetical protein